jgi:hypothetical protein
MSDDSKSILDKYISLYEDDYRYTKKRTNNT